MKSEHYKMTKVILYIDAVYVNIYYPWIVFFSVCNIFIWDKKIVFHTYLLSKAHFKVHDFLSFV